MKMNYFITDLILFFLINAFVFTAVYLWQNDMIMPNQNALIQKKMNDNNLDNGLELNWHWSKEDVLKTYAQQRRDRMGDAIGDYLTDEDIDARQAYEEMLAEVKVWVDYHQKFLVKAQNLYALMLGERPPISDNK